MATHDAVQRQDNPVDCGYVLRPSLRVGVAKVVKHELLRFPVYIVTGCLLISVLMFTFGALKYLYSAMVNFTMFVPGLPIILLLEGLNWNYMIKDDSIKWGVLVAVTLMLLAPLDWWTVRSTEIFKPHMAITEDDKKVLKTVKMAARWAGRVLCAVVFGFLLEQFFSNSKEMAGIIGGQAALLVRGVNVALTIGTYTELIVWAVKHKQTSIDVLLKLVSLNVTDTIVLAMLIDYKLLREQQTEEEELKLILYEAAKVGFAGSLMEYGHNRSLAESLIGGLRGIMLFGPCVLVSTLIYD